MGAPKAVMLGVHPEMDDLERDATPHRSGLFGDIHHAAPAFADSFQSLVVPERLVHRFVGRVGEIELSGGNPSAGGSICGRHCISCGSMPAETGIPLPREDPLAYRASPCRRR